MNMSKNKMKSTKNNTIRADGRMHDQIRDLKIEVGVLERASGSARVELGKNIVLISVNGPHELHPKHSSLSQKAVVRVNYRMLPFSVTYRKDPRPSRREKEISYVLSKAFESIVIGKLFPRTAIDVHVQMLQSDGGSRTAASIGITVALADAGIPMRGLIGGIASGIYKDKCILDLSGIEDNEGTGDMPLLFCPALDEISLFQLDGKFTLEQFTTCFNYSINALKKIENVQNQTLRAKCVTIGKKTGKDMDRAKLLQRKNDFSEPTSTLPVEESKETQEIRVQHRPSYGDNEKTSKISSSYRIEDIAPEGEYIITSVAPKAEKKDGVSEKELKEASSFTKINSTKDHQEKPVQIEQPPSNPKLEEKPEKRYISGDDKNG